MAAIKTEATARIIEVKQKVHRSNKVILGLTLKAYMTIDFSVNGVQLKTRKISFSTLLSSDEFKKLLKKVSDEEKAKGVRND
jgi:hypothetical protein